MMESVGEEATEGAGHEPGDPEQGEAFLVFVAEVVHGHEVCAAGDEAGFEDAHEESADD